MKYTLISSIVFALSLIACGEDETGSGGSTSGEESSGTCNAQVEIGFFTDADCTQPVMASEPTRVYDTTQACFSWEGNSAAGENSATRFQCFRDRLCYTQHPATLSCDLGSPTNKEARTDECVLDTQTPDGSRAIYAKVIRGTENCPEAPEGFECPVSNLREGTSGVAACTTEP